MARPSRLHRPVRTACTFRSTIRISSTAAGLTPMPRPIISTWAVISPVPSSPSRSCRPCGAGTSGIGTTMACSSAAQAACRAQPRTRPCAMYPAGALWPRAGGTRAEWICAGWECARCPRSNDRTARRHALGAAGHERGKCAAAERRGRGGPAAWRGNTPYRARHRTPAQSGARTAAGASRRGAAIARIANPWPRGACRRGARRIGGRRAGPPLRRAAPAPGGPTAPQPVSVLVRARA